MAGRQLPIVSLIVPAWLVVTMSGWRGLRGVWPAVLVSGGSFAIVQFLWSNYVGPELVDIIGGLVSLGCLGLFCAVVEAARSRGIFRLAESPGRSGRGPARLNRRAAFGPALTTRLDHPRVDALDFSVGVRHGMGRGHRESLPQRGARRRSELPVDGTPTARRIPCCLPHSTSRGCIRWSTATIRS